MNKCPIVFAHGAGAGPESPFMVSLAEALRAYGHPVHTFTFPYWKQVQETGRMRPPNPAAQLDEAMLDFCNALQLKDFVVMGKSMGARVAYRVADCVQARAAIALGFPFHPPGKELKHRLNDLYNQRPQNLIIQGERDPFGKRAWVEAQTLPEQITCIWAPNGDHELLATKRVQQQTGETVSMRWQWVAQQVTEWMETNT